MQKAEFFTSKTKYSQEINNSIGGTILIKALIDENVEFIWGYPGGSILYIYDEIYKQNKIQHILVRHEQAAIHAADAYSRSTGKVGVCLVTSGPGVTNSITGIATAYMDSIPIIIISGQVNTTEIGLNSFQECDTIGITKPCVKKNFLVKNVKKLSYIIKKAFYIAKTGRPGPVLIDIPKDISKTPCLYKPVNNISLDYNIPKISNKKIQEAVELIIYAKRPYIYSGGGVILSNASYELNEFVDLLGYPVTNTLMGLGGYRASDKKFLGMLGMHGTFEANMAMQYCDVLIAIGARFDDRVIGNPLHFKSSPRKIIHIDIDSSLISKRVKIDIPIVGDAKEILNKLILKLKVIKNKHNNYELKKWWKKIEIWRRRKCLSYKINSNDNLIKPQYILEKLWKLTSGNAFICSDVGQHQMWTAQFYHFNKPRKWINSGGLGTMGFGLPAGIGVKIAHPNDDVICISGEGSIQMCIQELSTCLQYKIPLKIIVLNNRYLGMVRQWQQIEYSKRYSNSYMEALPDFVKLAESYGHIGIKINKTSNVESALKNALYIKNRTVLLDFQIDPEENVWPMVQSGKGISEMIFGLEETI